MEQGSFQHQGFEGSLQLFLERARAEVLEARNRYPKETWPSFESFLRGIERVLEGELKMTLEVYDPSGLSSAESGSVTTFERSVRED